MAQIQNRTQQNANSQENLHHRNRSRSSFNTVMIQQGIIRYMSMHPTFAKRAVRTIKNTFENKYARQNNKQDEDQQMSQKQPTSQSASRPVSHQSKNKSVTYSHKSMAGKNIPLYLAGAFANISKKGRPYILAEIRKRRDVNPKAPFAGAYVSNTLARNGKTYHSQYMNVQGFNRILQANGKQPITSQQVANFAKSKPLIAKATNNLAFNANIMPNVNARNRFGNYDMAINPISITKPSKPFDYSKEYQINHQAYLNRQQSRQHVDQNQKNRTQQNNKQDLFAGF